MKVTLVPVEPVKPDVIIVLTYAEALQLRGLLPAYGNLYNELWRVLK